MSQPTPDSGKIYFEVYVGNDLTSSQTLKPAVIFDPSLNNLAEVNQLISTAVVKTVAYVFATNGMQVVYAPFTDISAVDGNRRVLLVNSNNSGDAGPELDAALQQEGLIALTAQRAVFSFDGVLPQEAPYVYGRDYNLGDLIEERTSDGYGSLMLVTEQIFSSDDTGEKTYPTLSVAQIITPGSWLSFEPTEDWADVPATQHWGDI